MSEKSKDILFLTLSAFLTAVAVQLFFKEVAFTPGGVTGLSIVLSALTSIEVEVVSLMISIPLLILGTVILGSQFGMKTLVVTLLIPLFLNLIPQRGISDNLIVISLVGGILVGLSISLAIWRKCATGGTDIIAMLIHKCLPRIKVSVALFVVDMTIVLCSWLISGSYVTAIYSALSLGVIIITIQWSQKKLKKEKKHA